jgi:hypothetical protein
MSVGRSPHDAPISDHAGWKVQPGHCLLGKGCPNAAPIDGHHGDGFAVIQPWYVEVPNNGQAHHANLKHH